MRWLLLAFFIIPALEIGVFIWVGGIVGPWWVVMLILLSGIVGIALAKQQGYETWVKARQSINNHQVPTEQIIDSICILVGAVLLFAPGFITDIFGILLVLPLTRKPFKFAFLAWVQRKISQGRIIYRK